MAFRDTFQVLHGDPWSKKLLWLVQALQLFKRRKVLVVVLTQLASLVDFLCGESTRTVKVEVDVERLFAESLDLVRFASWDVAMAHLFTHDTPVLSFHQRLIIGMSWSALGEFDEQLVEQLSDHAIDKLATVIRMKSVDDKRVLDKQIFEDGLDIMLADPLDATDDLPLGHKIDGIDVVDPLLPVIVALMDRVYA